MDDTEGAVNRRNNLRRSIRILGEPLERLAQVNIALILTQAVIVRLSLEIADESVDEPDPLVMLAFLGACVVAGVIIVMLSRVIRRFPRRWQRIAIALGSFVLQAAAFQILHSYAS
jgi:hypothetical protein